MPMPSRPTFLASALFLKDLDLGLETETRIWRDRDLSPRDRDRDRDLTPRDRDRDLNLRDRDRDHENVVSRGLETETWSRDLTSLIDSIRQQKNLPLSGNYLVFRFCILKKCLLKFSNQSRF